MSPRVYQFLTLATLSLTILLIIVGGATRVYDAGMACPDWPHCYGLWWPWPESRVIEAGHLEGYVVNGQHYVWWQVLLEWGHRGLAAVVGFGLIGLLIGSLWQPKTINTPLLLAAGLLAVQIKLGAVTVWFSNIHWSVVLHLGNAMLFTLALFWLWWRQRVPAPAVRAKAPLILWGLAVAAPVLVWLTMLMGAAVSSSHSGGVCGGLFSCAGVWLPSPKVDVGQHIHMQHRLFALLTFILSVVLLVVAKRRSQPPIRQAALQLHLMVLGQVVLGILTLYSFASFPEYYYPLSIAHLGWGTLTLLAAVAVPLTLASVPAAGVTKPTRKK
ncbi:MAG: COX15/CtaA family protein [Alphaproteobacteria bacterium]|nr:COX15/CtaA family protein [Alphaproteobacteria bacterium]